MQIGAVAKAVGMTPSAIRYYERRGLIQPINRVAGRREFNTRSIMTLRFLKFAQLAGFTLAETQKLLEMGFGDARPETDWRDFLCDKRKFLRARIEEVQRMDGILEQFEKCTCVSLMDCMSEAGDPSAQKNRP